MNQFVRTHSNNTDCSLDVLGEALQGQRASYETCIFPLYISAIFLTPSASFLIPPFIYKNNYHQVLKTGGELM